MMIKKRREHGFTLTELLIALILGILLLGGVFGVYLSNQTTSQATDDLSNLQNRVRLAFQVMSYDLRSAGFLGCNNAERLVSVVRVNNVVPPWLDWRGGLVGEAANAAGNEAIRLMYAAGQSSTVVTHVPPRLNVNRQPDMVAGDIAVVCDDTLSSLFQVSSVGATWAEHAQAGLNCATDLGFTRPLANNNCVTAPRNYPSDAMVMRFESVRWFVAPSQIDATFNSLYREIVVGGVPIAEEVLFGVARLQFAYQLRDAPFGPVAFSAALDMTQVIGVNVTILLAQNAYRNIDISQQMRTIEFFAAIRNRQR